jgi:carboxyl-terminal processing protease
LPSALDPEQFGEISSSNALPWDEIRGTLYEKTPVINTKIIADLNKSYQNRIKTDAELDRFVLETEETKKRINETIISLNEKKRKIEMEEAEQRRNASDKMGTTLGNKETKELNDLSELEDEYLREGLIVLSDLITSKIG